MSEDSMVPKLNQKQYNALIYMQQIWLSTGNLPDADELVNNLGLSRVEAEGLISHPHTLKRLDALGVPDPNRNKTLTEKQLLAATVILDPLDKRSKLKKLTELGISTKEYNSWLNDPLFRKVCLNIAENQLYAAQPTAHMALVERVNQGDLGAIKYFNAMTGRYREQRGNAAVEVNVQNNYGNDMLIKIVEIIQRHVKDPITLSAIGDDILALQQSTIQHSEFNNPRVISGRTQQNDIF